MELRVGHPPTARNHAALSAFMEWQQVNPESGASGASGASSASSDEIRPAGSLDGARASSVYPQSSSYNTDKTEDRPFPSRGFSSGASSVVTVINLKLQSAPFGTTSNGSTSSLCSHLSCTESAEASDNESPVSRSLPNTQHRRHSRRQFSFTSGDDSESSLKDPTTPAPQKLQNCPGILSKSLTYNVEQSSLAVSPTHVYATTQERRNGSNYSVTLDGRMEIFGPLGQLNGPKVSAVESLERVKASIHTTKRETGSLRELNGITSAAFARTVSQKA
jgi:hypothetical protein